MGLRVASPVEKGTSPPLDFDIDDITYAHAADQLQAFLTDAVEHFPDGARAMSVILLVQAAEFANSYNAKDNEGMALAVKNFFNVGSSILRLAADPEMQDDVILGWINTYVGADS